MNTVSTVLCLRTHFLMTDIFRRVECSVRHNRLLTRTWKRTEVYNMLKYTVC
jgi:hypothetical protein